ncbi:MAG: hypothetical protein U0263_21745 [Polyangiaceae bacterium]
MTKVGRALGVSMVASALAGGCSGSSSGDGGGAGNEYASKRSATCKSWQDAMCDFISDKCSGQARPDCDELYQSLFCKDDATMQACIDKLGTASCPSPLAPPAECKQINDAQPVVDFCKDFAHEVCAWGVRCKETSDQAACESSALADLASTCSAGVGLSATADQCLSDLKSNACSGQSPTSCKGVIKVLQSTPADVIFPGTTLFASQLVAPASAVAPDVVEAAVPE